MPALSEQLHAERLRELAALGFNPTRARILAEAVTAKGFLVSIHDIRKAIERGCTREMAFRIFR